VRPNGVVVLATPWAAAESALQAAGDLSGKVPVDATNPIRPGMVLTHGTTDLGAEQVARWAVGARVVKAFNSVGMEVMADPRFGSQPAALVWIPAAPVLGTRQFAFGVLRR
jgi:predicted dinucleotide-binding enzyme